MSLYYEAAKFIADAQASQTRLLGSQIYGSDELKSKPAHIVALISEAGKWSPVISSVVEAAEILKLQHKVSEFPIPQIVKLWLIERPAHTFAGFTFGS